MEDRIITTKEVGNYRIKIYYDDYSGESPIINWDMCGLYFFLNIPIYIDSYSGYIVEYPITLIEWVQGLKPGTVIKIGNVFSYHY